MNGLITFELVNLNPGIQIINCLEKAYVCEQHYGDDI